MAKEAEELSPAEEYHLQLRNVERTLLELEMASRRPLGAQDLCAALMHHVLATTCAKRYIIGTSEADAPLARVACGLPSASAAAAAACVPHSFSCSRVILIYVRRHERLLSIVHTYSYIVSIIDRVSACCALLLFV